MRPDREIIGTAGWSVPKAFASSFPLSGSHLERYAQVFAGVEIDTSFYRHHQPKTYAKWAAATPTGFRFAVKTPKLVTHEHALAPGGDEELARFFDEAAGLGPKLGVVLVQLPPRLAFDARTAAAFFGRLRSRYGGGVALEPRHRSWFTAAGEALLLDYDLARVAADPALLPAAAEPAGSPSLRYFRLHGSPQMYYSAYDEAYLRHLETRFAAESGQIWCIFDNTALGHAAGDALTMLASRPNFLASKSTDELHVGAP